MLLAFAEARRAGSAALDALRTAALSEPDAEVRDANSLDTLADGIAKELNASLAAILGGQSGMEQAFGSGDQEEGENARQTQGSANFDAARFRGR
ncbi:hypothetical protein ABZY34_16770 [Streptomyces virginiae]